MNMRVLFYYLLFISCSFQALKAQEISVTSGLFKYNYIANGQELNKSELDALFMKNAETNTLWTKYKKHKTLSYIAVGATIGFLAWELSDGQLGNSGIAPPIGMLVSSIAGLICITKAEKELPKAINTYSNSHSQKTSFQLLPAKEGIGFVFVF